VLLYSGAARRSSDTPQPMPVSVTPAAPALGLHPLCLCRRYSEDRPGSALGSRGFAMLPVVQPESAPQRLRHIRDCPPGRLLQQGFLPHVQHDPPRTLHSGFGARTHPVHLRDSYEARCGYLLLPLFEPHRISRHGTTAHVLLLVSSWRSWPASLTAMSLRSGPQSVPSDQPHSMRTT
jgi:hypothetical protein